MINLIKQYFKVFLIYNLIRIIYIFYNTYYHTVKKIFICITILDSEFSAFFINDKLKNLILFLGIEIKLIRDSLFNFKYEEYL